MLAIIGGSGIYQFDGLTIVKEHSVDTPFGQSPVGISEGKFGAHTVFFLARHGKQHQLLPHEVNYRANIWALKSIGVTMILGLSATGSLQQEIAPGDLSLPNQYIDFVKGQRHKTFFGQGLVAHVSTAQPTCSSLSAQVIAAAAQLKQPLHTEKTYICVDGPRLGTRAESLFFKNVMQADLVGMTNVPEVFLAREAQICYLTLAVATDYDCWQDDPAHHVSVSQVISRYGASLEKAKTLIKHFLSNQHQLNEQCSCRHSLEMAMLSTVDTLSAENKVLFEVLSS
ncbi:MAG: S-methyl-5'-thioadenosine phosphorylase [Psychrobium sp.]|nr:S-methyl-5'-thioadenosine phosphorylase [Psychrobium sp.]